MTREEALDNAPGRVIASRYRGAPWNSSSGSAPTVPRPSCLTIPSSSTRAGCPTWTANGPVLSPEERVVLFRFLLEHAVAECEQCAKSYYRMTELASDLSAAESTSARAAAQI
jgi:hypothetical protein